MFEYTIRATMDRSEPRSQQYKFLRPSFSVNEYTIAIFAQILIKLHHDEFSWWNWWTVMSLLYSLRWKCGLFGVNIRNYSINHNLKHSTLSQKHFKVHEISILVSCCFFITIISNIESWRREKKPWFTWLNILHVFISTKYAKLHFI